MRIARGLTAVSVLVLLVPQHGLASGDNVLENPSLLKGEKTKVGTEPANWTRRGQMKFSDAKMVSADEAYAFSLTAEDGADFPTCSKGGALHYDGAEAGYFQVHRAASPGETWRGKIGAKLMSGGRARLFVYAKDDKGGNVDWVSALSKKRLKRWKPLRVTMTVPAGTDHILLAFRGRLCNPGTEDFRFRRAKLKDITP